MTTDLNVVYDQKTSAQSPPELDHDQIDHKLISSSGLLVFDIFFDFVLLRIEKKKKKSVEVD